MRHVEEAAVKKKMAEEWLGDAVRSCWRGTTTETQMIGMLNADLSDIMSLACIFSIRLGLYSIHLYANQRIQRWVSIVTMVPILIIVLQAARVSERTDPSPYVS